MKVIVGALTISCALYVQVGTLVYLTFGPDTKDDFTKNFRPDDALLILVRFTMAMSICATFPLVMIAARNTTLDLFLQSDEAQPPTGARIALATLLTGLCLIMAEKVGSLNIVMGFNGALFGTPVSYVLPMVMYLTLPREKQSRRWRSFSGSCAVIGVLFGLLGAARACASLAQQ